MKKYKVTGKFCILNAKEEVVRDEVYINKIEKGDNPQSAMRSVIKIMAEKFAKKYGIAIKLQQLSNILVKRI
ncbi:MAG: hypothetical protein CO140_01805 [Candidatus Moranbacteria bacterium CG_4_9_14_3_um_filter_40_7]|nr:MAG: hypothetical protein CO140_01805 [Candidatus Moranbacteria bacterium CG_4_9_14_3_um_filter_40_7]